MIEYTVQKGDTLYGIAKQFGTSVSYIKRLNNLVTDQISVGQVLKIKEDTKPTKYIVQKGDTLYSISKRFNIPVLKLMKINNITSRVLQIGQVLKLVDDTNNSDEGIITMPLYEKYIVQRGDNLYSIARKFNVSVEQIKRDNNLINNLLTVGQVLKIKVGEEIFGIEECYGKGYSDLGKNYITYTVKRGDNLYSIARNYNTTVEEIKKINNLSSDLLTVGQQLKVKEVV